MIGVSTPPPIRVGVLFSETGVTALVERTQRRAVELALEELNTSGGVLGRPLQAVIYDPASDPRRYRQLAEDLLETDGIEVIFGCYMSSTRKAVLPVVERRGGLLFYPTLYEGFEFSPNCIYSGAAPNQNSVSLARFLMQHYGRRFYLVGSNYVFPYESNRIIRDYISSHGGKVVEERYIPLNASDEDIGQIIADVGKCSPSVIISTVVGDGTTLLYRAYRKAGFDPDKMPIGSLTTCEPEVAQIGSEAAEGHYTSAPYFQSIRSTENARFVDAYQRRFGPDQPISSCTEAAYFQVHLFARAAERAGSTAIDKIKQALPGCEFPAPQGPVRVDQENNHTYLWPRIGRVGSDGRFTIEEESSVPVKPDPYMITPEDENWGSQSARNGGAGIVRLTGSRG